MEQPKKELIEGIADLFEDYQEAYVPGEWEAFSKGREKKKYPFFRTWISIAAVLCLISSVVFYRLNQPLQLKNKSQITLKKSGVTPFKQLLPAKDELILPITDKLVQSAPGNKLNVEKHSLGTNHKKAHYRADIADSTPFQLLPDNDQLIAAALAKPSIEGNQLVNDKSISIKQDNSLADSAVNLKKEKISTLDFLLAESKNPVKIKEKKDKVSKWDFGLEVAPSMTRQNMNIGGGLTTAYRLSSKFSLSSGISVLQLEAGQDIPISSAQASTVSFNAISEKELLSVDANIKAIDIPIAIVYKLNKHLYTSAGVSYFNVISEKRNNTYTQTSEVFKTFANPVTGELSGSRAVISEVVAETTPETPLRGNSYLGFFNFSVGRRQSLFNKYNILIEPFIKVPIGRLSSQELKLMNSGLKFQISF